jgi:phosphoribosylglycinamide formyltransferase-1
MKKSLAILASHNGSGFDALYDAMSKDILDIDISLIISNNSDAAILQKAANHSIDHFIINGKNSQNPDQEIYKLLKDYHCDIVFLSGYMKKISSDLTNNFQIINSHPALLPKYGGAGMYGKFIHEAVIENKEKQSGCTIHYVNENYDEGKIILQKSLLLEPNETAHSLEQRVKKLEKEAIVEAFKILLPCGK